VDIGHGREEREESYDVKIDLLVWKHLFYGVPE